MTCHFRKNVKKPGNEKWISMTCEKVNSSSGILLHSPDDSTLSKTDHYAFRHAKKTLNENNKDKGEMSEDTLDDINQSLESNRKFCNLPPSNYIEDDIPEKRKVLPVAKPSVEFVNSEFTKLKRTVQDLQKMVIGMQEELFQRRKSKAQLASEKAECEKELCRSRLEGEKQNREKLQAQIHHPSCASSAVLEQEYQTSKVNLQQEQDEWLLLKVELIDKIDILSIQISKSEDEIYQLHNALKMNTLLLEEIQREVKEWKDELKELRNEDHIEKKKWNRPLLKQESLPETLTQRQKKITLSQEPFEDSQNKAVFISKGVQVPFKDSPMTFCADTEKKDPVLEERNKESIDEISIPLREKLRKLENEEAKRKDAIRKLPQELADSQKMSLQEILSHQTVLYMKQKLQEKVDETTNQKSQEEDKQKLQYLKERGDYIQKLKMESAIFEDSEKQQVDKTENFPNCFLQFLLGGGEMSADTLDDITQSLETDPENCNLPPSNYIEDSYYIWGKKKAYAIYKPLIKFKNSQWAVLKKNIKDLEKLSIAIREELPQIGKPQSELKTEKAERERELDRSRFEGEKQNREKLQAQIHYPSCASSAVLEQEYQTSKLNLQQEQDKWLLLKEELIDKIDILSIQISKIDNEIYQLHNALKMNTLLLEEMQRGLKDWKDELKELRNENHIEKKKWNRSLFEQESLPETLTQMQKKITLSQKPFEDSQNKAVFISKGVQMPFKDSSMPYCADTAKKDPVLEERNKESVDEISIPLREKLRKLENEEAKRKDTIRKLPEELADSQKMSSQEILSHQTVLYMKQKLQEKADETTNQKSQEEDKQKLQYLKERGDYIQKLKMESATFEDSEKQQVDKTEKIPNCFLQFLLDGGEMSADTLDDITQSLETDPENCNLPPSNYIEDSYYIWGEKKAFAIHKSLIKFKNSQWAVLKKNIKDLEKMSIAIQNELSQIGKPQSELKTEKAEHERELHRSGFEGEKQNREKLQAQIHYPSCASSAVLEQEYQTSELNLQQEQDKWLLKEELIDKIEILLIQHSKIKDEIYQQHNALKMNTLLLEEIEREFKECKDELKELRKENHLKKKKWNRSLFKQESLQERLTQMQKKIMLSQKPFEDSQNKAVFISKGVQVPFKDSSMTFCAVTGKKDAVLEQEYQTSELNLQQEQDKWLLKEELIDKIEILLIQHSKIKDEIYQQHNALKMNPLLLEEIQREFKECKDELKELRKEKHLKKKKWNRSLFKQEALQERLTQLQKKITLSQKPFEDSQNKAVFIAKGVQVPFKDSSMTFCAVTGKKDAVLEQEYQTSELNLQQEQDKWLLKEELIDKIEILLIQHSKIKDEIYQQHNALKMNPLLLEEIQREFKECKDELKELRKEKHLKKKKWNRSLFKQEALQERLTQLQKKITLSQKPFEDSQNKAVFISKGVQVPFKDSSMTFCAVTGKKDAVLEERNKKSVDEISIPLREKLRKLENEEAKRKDTVRKLHQELADSQKGKLMTSQEVLSRQTKVLYMEKKVQEKADETTNQLQKSQEEDKQKLWYLKEREDYIQKLKVERATFEDAEKQPMDKTGKFPKHFCKFLVKSAEEHKQKLDPLSSRNRHIESMNRHLQEEEKLKYDRLHLKHHLGQLNYNRLQEYGPKVKEQVKGEAEEQIQKLKAKSLRRKIVHQELKEHLERSRKQFSQVYRFTTGPFLKPMNDDFLDPSVVLPRRNSIFFTENTESSGNSTEDCFSAIQQTMEDSVAKSDDAVSELPSTSRWASPRGCNRRPNMNWDPVSRNKQY
ncbi:ankyrin repeat domain-containing protein 26-like isoform X2 [Antechinus flavipes]|uniref:ankyrin repeat domain-containing protein 26-like isoform X2 n=1 Tax=Antechinus flavipes TaxID=38775 RepID=UPI00223666DF|nr:ankyrin repeat domain-containing protein 26-like isoform X2 [Antechinus flavipes]